MCPDQVIVLPGLLLPGAALAPFARRLSRAGFECRIAAYRSWREPPEAAFARLDLKVQAVTAAGGSSVHWVGHSLGGLIVLHYLAARPALPPGRVVLLGSPLAGSALAARLGRNRTGRLAVGAARSWLEQGAAPPPRRQVGMIAGTRALGFGRLMGGSPAGDGTVALAETHHPALTGRIELPVTHSGMLLSSTVVRAAAVFLARGTFRGV